MAARKVAPVGTGRRNAGNGAAQPVTEVRVHPAVMAAVRVLIGPDGDPRRIRINGADSVTVMTRPAGE